jgi:hypothetical protein
VGTAPKSPPSWFPNDGNLGMKMLITEDINTRGLHSSGQQDIPVVGLADTAMNLLAPQNVRNY